MRGKDTREVRQVLCPMNRRSIGASALNTRLQEALNPNEGTAVTRFGRTFRSGDRVLQTVNFIETLVAFQFVDEWSLHCFRQFN